MTGLKQHRSLVVMTLSFALSACAWAQGAPPQTSVPSPKIQADDDKSLTGEIPIDTPGAVDPKDISAVSSPVPASRSGLWIKPGTALSLRMDQPVSSDKQGNGTLVNGVLLQPVRMANGTLLPKGTPVKATVLAAAPAGKIQSAGVLSLQVTHVGSVSVTTNVLEFSGKPGKAEVADAAPAKGTEAMVQPGTALQFKVLGAGDTWDSSQRNGDKTGRSKSGQKGMATQPNKAQPSVSTQAAPGMQAPIHGATQGVTPKQ